MAYLLMRDTAIREHPVRITNLVLPPSARRVLEVPLEALEDVASTVACICQVVAFERKQLHFYRLLHGQK